MRNPLYWCVLKREGMVMQKRHKWETTCAWLDWAYAEPGKTRIEAWDDLWDVTECNAQYIPSIWG